MSNNSELIEIAREAAAWWRGATTADICAIPTSDLLDRLATALSTAQGEVEAAERERDEAYVVMIDTGGFLRGYGDAAEVAARRLVQAVPDSFDDREDAVRAALAGLHKGEET